MTGFHVINHPLIQAKMAMLRNVETSTKEFREICGEVATLICYEAAKDMPLVEVEVETPLCTTKCLTIGKKIAFVPILRAGLGMVDGMHHLIPTAKVGHIGLYRDPKTLEPVEYFCKLPPDICEREVFLLDPMLATGGTASMAIDFLKKRNVKSIRLLVLLSCPVGVERIQREHPDVGIYTACNDPELNDHGYIVPGLGDAGDRIFGTK